MAGINHRFVETNGIKMHITEVGKGPLVIMCHGFPELAYSWRHQLPALAEAGFHAVAPDQRGYGQTDRPDAIEEYSIFKLVGDIVGLVYALGEEKAVIVGDDWGSRVAAHCALLRPDVFRALVQVGVPYRMGTWDKVKPTDVMRKIAGDKEHYQVYFQELGRAERELEADVRKSMLLMLFTGSGNVPREKRTIRFIFDKTRGYLDAGALPDALPAWLTENDLNFFTQEFKRTGFRGGLNWYRNIDKNWESMCFANGEKLYQPSLFLAGQFDGVVYMYRADFDAMEKIVPNLKKKVLIPGAGHWVTQEKPDEVNKLLIEFLNGL
ncbi:MAG: alpha/beta hydrolase [Dehalococcoidales bacterium]|nr:alpha/beta hydrolase [Dehalococcoidales bacterium]